MPKVKSWRLDDPRAPKFPKKFEVVKKAVLQKTDLVANNNKYYAIELHKPKSGKTCRVFTHYGRTDDLQHDENAGAKECRYFDSQVEAEGAYEQIYRQKTGASKGYHEVSLASSKIGSKQTRGKSVGKVDNATLSKGAKGSKGAKKTVAKKAAVKKSRLPTDTQGLVKYLYDEATTALTQTVQAQITADGIETPLGVLTLGQIDKGEAILDDLYGELKKKRKNKNSLKRLSGAFYTEIPHRIGRSRRDVDAAVIRDLTAYHQKAETLQLMRDMLHVSGESTKGGNVLFDAGVDGQYGALGCKITSLKTGTAKFKKWEKLVLESQVYKGIKVVGIHEVSRKAERKVFRRELSNMQFLFHGSNIKNWVGILSRGILLPKVVVAGGGTRTDEGWLGSGIYFSNEASTAAQYTAPGKKRTCIMAVAKVALGKQKHYDTITYGLSSPPKGFHSTHGVSDRDDPNSEFDDNELVIYDQRQQQLEVLVEFKQ